MSCRASVAEVVSRVTIGLRVMISDTGVIRGSRPSAVTYKHQPTAMSSLSSWAQRSHADPCLTAFTVVYRASFQASIDIAKRSL